MLTVRLTSGRSSASRASSVTPKTTCRITSRVSAFIRSSDSNGSSALPAADLGLGEAGDQVLVAAQRVPVERRHQQLAGALVLGGVDEQQRVLAHHRAEDRVALAGVEDLGVTREDLLDVLGPVEHDEASALGQDPDREDVAVAPVQRRDELVPEPQQPDALQRSRAAAARAAGRPGRPRGRPPTAPAASARSVVRSGARFDIRRVCRATRRRARAVQRPGRVSRRAAARP